MELVPVFNGNLTHLIYLKKTNHQWWSKNETANDDQKRIRNRNLVIKIDTIKNKGLVVNLTDDIYPGLCFALSSVIPAVPANLNDILMTY